MNRKQWEIGYSLVRSWMHNRISETEYFRLLNLAGIGRHSLIFVRAYSLRSELYGKDTTKAARDRIDRKMHDWRMCNPWLFEEKGCTYIINKPAT